MHIAVCDDNVADRHQIERLLKRESDKRAATTGILYTDSFGNCDTLLANPMQYDAFYIDMCLTEGVTGLDVVAKLTQAGVNAPIIMCCSAINYREFPLPDNVFFLDKPIRAAELSESIDHALHIRDQAAPLIELRGDKETFYVTEPEVLYAIEDGRLMLVTLTDGRIIPAVTDTANLFEQLEKHPTFLAPASKLIINGRYIARLGIHKAFMTDGSVFKIHRDCMKYAKKIFEEYH